MLIVANIAHVQCVSTAQYKCAFIVQNYIKIKFCDWFQIKNLEFVMRLALEGPSGDATHVLMEAAILWKNFSKFKFLFFKLQKYLVDVFDINEDECTTNA